jgi:hypothetical protein
MDKISIINNLTHLKFLKKQKKELIMNKNRRFTTIRNNHLWMVIVVSAVTLLATACGSSAASQSNTGSGYGMVDPTAPVTSTSPASASGSADACTLLTQDDVSQAIGVAVDNVTPSGLGGVCNYSTANLKMDLTVSHTGGVKYLQDTRAKLGSDGVDVPGLGDGALFNPNSSMLMVVKGDAVYLFSYYDSSQQLTQENIQAKEKAMAEQLLSRLP